MTGWIVFYVLRVQISADEEPAVQELSEPLKGRMAKTVCQFPNYF